MTWIVQASDVDSFDPAKTTGQNLYDRDDDLFERGSTFYFAEILAATIPWVNATWTSGAIDIRVRVPPYVLTGDLVKLKLLFVGGTGANQHSLRLTGTDSTPTTTNGTTLTTDNASYAVETLSLTVPDDTWASSIITFDVEANKNASDATLSIKTERMALNLYYEKG